MKALVFQKINAQHGDIEDTAPFRVRADRND